MVMIPLFQQYDMVLLCKTDILVDTTKIFTAFTRVAIPTRAGILPYALLSLPKAIKVLSRCG